MSESKKSTRPIYTDLAAFDAHVIQPEEYDDLPELTDEMMERGTLYVNGVAVRRGRPPVPAPKKSVTLRLDDDVLSHFRALGPGWQTKINDVLRKSAKLKRA